MRAKDKIRLGTIRMALAAVKQHEIDGRLDPNYVEINDDGVLAILIKMVKQRKDAASQYETAGRQDLLDIELAEIVILQDFLPKALSDEELDKAIQYAGYDLVEVAPTADPPVCRIMDFGKFKYEQSKKQHRTKQHQKSTQVKEIKLRPRTDKHDLETKVRQIRGFLEEGNKTKVTVMFRGREMANKEFGFTAIQKVIEGLNEVGIIESAPRLEGRNLFMIVSPK